jgi:hypothetical protein
LFARIKKRITEINSLRVRHGKASACSIIHYRISLPVRNIRSRSNRSSGHIGRRKAQPTFVKPDVPSPKPSGPPSFPARSKEQADPKEIPCDDRSN